MNSTVLDAKIKEVDNQTNYLNGLIKKTDYDAKISDIKAKISDIEGKYFTSSDYNKFTSDITDANIKQKELVKKSEISNFVKIFDLSKKLATLATNLH